MIVIVILGVLAAIVVPRLSSASNEARQSGIAGQLQVIRRQIELYKMQHQDDLPDITADWSILLQASVGGTPPQTFGPYLVVLPMNPMNGFSSVTDGDGSAPAASPCGFVYDFDGGSGTGKLFATDKDGVTILSY